MMNCLGRSLISLVVIWSVFIVAPILGQVTTGTPPLSSLQTGSDIVNLSNLNVHIDVPVFQRAGRGGMDFNYHLAYDSSMWFRSSSTGSAYWVLNTNDPLLEQAENNADPVVGNLVVNTHLVDICGTTGKQYARTFVYIDASGTPHPFSGSYDYVTGTGCGSNGPIFTGVTTDGSGYTLTYPGWTLYDKWGSVPGREDRNGNITTITSSFNSTGTVLTTNYYDTTSSTIPVLIKTMGWVSGSQANTITYAYTAPSGAQATFAVKYNPHTLQTHFGCSGVSEYGPGTVSLLSEIDLPDNSKYIFTYEPTPGFPSSVTGRLASITFPTGGTISYKYTGGSNGITCADGSAAGLQRTTPDTGTGYWNYSQVQGTGGASTTTLTDPQNNHTVMQFQGGYETQRQVYQGAINTSNLLLTTTTCYVSTANPQTCSNTPTLPLSGRQVTSQPGGSNLVSMHAEQYDAYGNVTGTQNYDYGTGGPGVPLRQTSMSYASLTNIHAFPQQVTVKDGSGNTIQQTVYNYTDTVTSSSGTPQLKSPSGSRGNLQSVNSYTSLSAFMAKSFTYFDTGIIQTSTDVNGAVTTNVFPDATSTCGNAFPRTVNRPLNMSQSSTWNCTGGVLTAVTDENGNTTTATYNDPYFWRPASISYPDRGLTIWTYNSPTSTTTTTKMNSSQNIVSTILLDGLGRTKQTQLNSDLLGVDDVDVTYDSLGRVFTVSHPHRSTSSPTDGLTTTYYDALGRTCLVVPPDGTLPSGSGCPASQPSNTKFTTFSANTSTVTDQAGKSRKLVVNALGQLTQVTEDPAGLGYLTSYSYDALGNLTGVVQNGSRQRTFVYDLLSHLTSATNPESGTVTFTYDANGNLGTKTSPAPNQAGSATVTATYNYDALHRLTQESYSDGTPTAGFSYDVHPSWGLSDVTNVVGRLVEASVHTGSTNTSTVYSYDPEGRVVREWQQTPSTFPGGYFVYHSYDLAGDVLSATNAAGVTISYNYDAASRPASVTSSWNDAQHPSTLFTADPSSAYFPTGALRKAVLSNGLTIDNMYNNRLQPCRLNVNSSGTSLVNCTDAVPGGNVLDFAYTYNSGTANNGNVASWTSVGNQTFTRSYGYDSLNRLSSFSDSASTQACKGLTWNYDAWGNLLGQNNTGGSCFTFSASVGTNNRLGSPYAYDAAGNMTYDGTHTYTYDAENRLSQVDAGVTAIYTYDANGVRVRKSVGGTWTEFFRDSVGKVTAELTPSGWGAEYAHMNGLLIAQYSGGSTYSIFADHLGSTRLVTGLNKAVVDSLDYLPFGLQVAGNTSTTHKFSGKESDSETASVPGGTDGLDNFGARYYGSGLGRFMSPDPLGALAATPAFPQSWNLYAYVMNNPLAFIDPSGLDCAYLDDNGGTDSGGPGGASIDHNSNIGECQQNGGYWGYGYIDSLDWVMPYNDGSDNVGIYSWQNGQLNWNVATQDTTLGAYPVDSFQAPWDSGPSWMGTFSLSLLSFSGGPGNKPTCAGQTLRSIAGDLTGTNQAGVPAGETALKAAAAQQAAKAAEYAASRPNSLGGVGLICPRCSAVFRSMMFKSEAAEFLGEAAVPLDVSVAAAKSIPEVSEQARGGGCAAAFPIF
jgi:RHS repeat-associated protein